MGHLLRPDGTKTEQSFKARALAMLELGMSRLNVLTFTSLFPNQTLPQFGGFVSRRMERWAERWANKWVVIAPVPYFPSIPIQTPWGIQSKVPSIEFRGQWRVIHPRYVMIPKIGARIQGVSMALCSLAAVKRLIAQEGHVNLIDSHYIYPDAYAALIIAKKFRLPLVASARGTDINLYPDLPRIRPKIHRVLREADTLIGVSASLTDRMIALGAPEQHCHTIPNGVDLELFYPEASRKIGPPGPNLLAVGNLNTEKGFDLLLQAFELAISAKPDLSLSLVGTGPEEASLKELARSLRIENRVDFLGTLPHDDLPNLYRSAGILCLTSQREGCPNVVMEALACGTPVVATAVGGVPELIHDDVNGMLIRERNAQMTAAAIKKVIEQAWDPWKIRKTLRARSWANVAEELQGVFVRASKAKDRRK